LEARKSRELTQISVARALGRPQSYVADAERHERRVDVIEFLELADAIGFDPTAVLQQVKSVDGKVRRPPTRLAANKKPSKR
jgi:hypothetical protein